ncbi:S53 family serine peptidase [Fulvimonas sp. R45]|uniref:S53 family peptidase n=1 Tax=Fulvimonas sp. R45 TaxID=3045937 RepID=UPI00265F8F2C|nr:S53 family serine peptidase [Fulvimonas sp. R45]MDO1529976.1 S53 family serine peptidase [Fulvimonas sp. R45]
MNIPAPRRHWHAPKHARYLGPHDDDAPLDVTLVLRRRGEAPPAAAWPLHPPMRRADFGARCGADPADLDRARDFARTHGLQETGCQPHRRALHLRGPAAALQRAFGVRLGHYQPEDGGAPFVGCAEAPALPEGVIAVLGLDRRPVARPQFRKPLAQPSRSYTPLQLGQLYGFPAGDGGGQGVAIIEFGGGYQESDLATYFQSLGLAKTPTVTAVSVAGGQNQPGGDADAEVMLDIEVAGALAPAAKFAVYFAPNTDQGFYEAISQAAHDDTHKPSVMSISWGGPEDSWTGASRDAMQSALQDAVALGVTVAVAAGDSGSSDGEDDGQPHVDFPASSPYALACGGTRLVANGSAINSETVWNETRANEGATGGGVSTAFPLPDWQQDAGVPRAPDGSAGRGVPDVAGDADPRTGYQVRVDGEDQVIGGTSAVAPLWAALLARLNQQLGAPLGDAHAAIYQIGGKAFRDVTVGDNGDYQAGTGWDACTGWGSPDGQTLLDALTALGGSSGSA